MTPYYADAAVTLYHADSREVLSSLFADVLVTDPPYGYSHASGWDSPWRDRPIEGDESTDARDAVLAMWPGPAIVFGHCKMPAPIGVTAVLVWDKGPASGMGDLSMPWKPNWEHIYVLGRGFEGRRDSGVIKGHTVVTWSSKGRVHPNQKPVSLMGYLMSRCPPGVVIDPFAGSGSTLVAAKNIGRRVIGIETDESWCETAANRCSQEVLGLSA